MSENAIANEGIRVLHLGRPPKTVVIEEPEGVSIQTLIERGILEGGAEQYFLNGQQVDEAAIVKPGDGLVLVDSIVAG